MFQRSKSDEMYLCLYVQLYWPAFILLENNKDTLLDLLSVVMAYTLPHVQTDCMFDVILGKLNPLLNYDAS